MTPKQRKLKAIKISEMWNTIAESEYTLGFWCKSHFSNWVQTVDAPNISSDLKNWKVAPFDGDRVETKIAKYFARLWLDVSEGANFLFWDYVDSSWKIIQNSAPCYCDSMENWTIAWKPDPVAYIWKRVDNGDLTEDSMNAEGWKMKGYRVNRYTFVEKC